MGEGKIQYKRLYNHPFKVVKLQTFILITYIRVLDRLRLLNKVIDILQNELSRRIS